MSIDNLARFRATGKKKKITKLKKASHVGKIRVIGTIKLDAGFECK